MRWDGMLPCRCSGKDSGTWSALWRLSSGWALLVAAGGLMGWDGGVDRGLRWVLV